MTLGHQWHERYLRSDRYLQQRASEISTVPQGRHYLGDILSQTLRLPVSWSTSRGLFVFESFTWWGCTPLLATPGYALWTHFSITLVSWSAKHNSGRLQKSGKLILSGNSSSQDLQVYFLCGAGKLWEMAMGKVHWLEQEADPWRLYYKELGPFRTGTCYPMDIFGSEFPSLAAASNEQWLSI